jgi:Peptidase inhibitor family I36
MKNRLVLAFSIVGLLLYGSAISASAVTAHQAPSSRPSTEGQYCTAQAEPAGSMATPTVTCYSTFSASIRAATGGTVRLPASAKAGSVTPDELNAAASTGAAATVFVLSINYKDINFGGATLTWTQSRSCGAFQAGKMPSGWNDVVSSVVTESGCANTLYKNITFGGTTFSIGRNSSAANLGSFNDLTSSEKWCTARPC